MVVVWCEIKIFPEAAAGRAVDGEDDLALCQQGRQCQLEEGRRGR